MTSAREFDWVDGCAHRLIHCAARRAPESLSERLEEEWLADLAERHGGFSRLGLAIGCYWATYTIAREDSVASREHSVSAVAATNSSVARANFGGYSHDESSLFSRRSATFLLVASLHAAVLCGLAVGLSSNFVKLSPHRLEATVIEKTLPPRNLPAPSKPVMTAPTIDQPPVNALPPIERDPAQTEPVRETSGELPGSVMPPAVPVAVNRVQGGPGIGFPSADDFYPSSAIRREEQGIATVKACVDRDGRLTSDPTIIRPTGSPRLDQGALRLAMAGSGYYRASTEDGRPVNSCYPFNIRFNLRK